MKLVVTLLARNEADLVAANVSFHLSAGADLVVATDNRSDDGTTEILEAFAREGHVHLIREAGSDMRQGEWVTRMARLAARELGADWLIHADADEFYWPRGGTLKEVLAEIPPDYGSVRAFVRTFLLQLGESKEPFYERMTTRISTPAPIHDPASIFRPGSKLIHRAHPAVRVGDGTHALHGIPLPELPGHHPIEMLHFPFRSEEQTRRKLLCAYEAWARNPSRSPPHYYTKAYAAIREGRVDEVVEALACPNDAGDCSLRDVLVRDTRLRDALRQLRGDGAETAGFRPRTDIPLQFGRATAGEEAQYAAEAAALLEAEVVRLQRRLDALYDRVARLWPEVGAELARLA
jgi:hypothetical protein